MREILIIGKTPNGNYERLQVPAAGVTRLTAAYRNGAGAVFITVEDNNIRYRIDGGDPDANDGHIVYAAGNLYFEDPASIRNLRMIGNGGAAIVIVTYYH